MVENLEQALEKLGPNVTIELLPVREHYVLEGVQVGAAHFGLTVLAHRLYLREQHEPGTLQVVLVVFGAFVCPYALADVVGDVLEHS